MLGVEVFFLSLLCKIEVYALFIWERTALFIQFKVYACEKMLRYDNDKNMSMAL